MSFMAMLRRVAALVVWPYLVWLMLACTRTAE
jgi:hypothetical protein